MSCRASTGQEWIRQVTGRRVTTGQEEGRQEGGRQRPEPHDHPTEARVVIKRPVW